MDNIFIVIAVVAFFLLRTYMNYKQEQEEAGKRNPSAPQPSNARPVQKEGHQPMDIPKWLEDFLPPQPEVRPEPVPVPVEEHHGSIDYTPTKYEQVKYVPLELPADLLKEYRNLPEKIEIDEVKRSSAMLSSHSYRSMDLNPVVVSDVEATIEVPRFDLRQAVIMNAILERPYQ